MPYSMIPKSWFLFIFLCLIWGSSFVLMKLGMFTPDGSLLLSAWQVASLRMLTSGLVLLPFAIRAWQRIPASLRGLVFFSGWLGSFIPAILFCVAESKIDSALAGSLNAMTPLFTIAIAAIFYATPIPQKKVLGVVIGLMGCLFLFWAKSGKGTGQMGFASLVLLATICYGWNVNVVKNKMQGISALDIASLAFVGLIPFSLTILWLNGYFSLPLGNPVYLKATAAATLLGTVGTAIASIIFYELVKLSGIVFASLVTYGIPFVAIGWGLIYGETIIPAQIIALMIILGGVYLANKPNAKNQALQKAKQP